MTTLSEAKRRLAAAQAELRDAERRTRRRFGSEPDVGTVLTFQKRFGGAKSYWYAAIRTPVGWYLTGNQVESMDWRALCDFIGDGRCAVATEWEKLPDVGELTGTTLHMVDEAPAALKDEDEVPHGMVNLDASLARAVSAASWRWRNLMTLDPFTVLQVVVDPINYEYSVQDTRGAMNATSAEDERGVPLEVARFQGDGAQARAEQSARDRNAAARRVTLANEPPVGTRVHSARKPRSLFATRTADARKWVIHYESTPSKIIRTRCSWQTVVDTLGSMVPDRPSARTAQSVTKGKGVPSWYQRSFDETDYPEWTSG